jgi:hypothetical protein
MFTGVVLRKLELHVRLPQSIPSARQHLMVSMDLMLAARLHRIGDPMVLESLPVPGPRPTDVLVEVKACGIVPNLGNVLTHWQTWFPELPLPKLPAIFGLAAGRRPGVGSRQRE